MNFASYLQATTSAIKFSTVSSSCAINFSSVSSNSAINFSTVSSNSAIKFSSVNSNCTVKFSSVILNCTIKFSSVNSSCDNKFSSVRSNYALNISSVSSNYATKFSSVISIPIRYLLTLCLRVLWRENRGDLSHGKAAWAWSWTTTSSVEINNDWIYTQTSHLLPWHAQGQLYLYVWLHVMVRRLCLEIQSPFISHTLKEWKLGERHLPIIIQCSFLQQNGESIFIFMHAGQL